MRGEIEREIASLAEGTAQMESPIREDWPFVAGKRLAFLLDAASSIERRLLDQWIDTHRPEAISPASCERIAIPSSRRGRGNWSADRRLEACLAVGDDPVLAPLRIAWLPPEKNGQREVRFSDVVTFGDPRDPGLIRQAWLQHDLDRYRVVVAEPAPASAFACALETRRRGFHAEPRGLRRASSPARPRAGGAPAAGLALQGSALRPRRDPGEAGISWRGGGARSRLGEA
jgi:hypothetical protein